MKEIGKPIRPQAGEEEFLTFSSGASIQFKHYQECCEYNYPDFKSLDDTGFWEQDFDELTFETFEGGVRINGYTLNCYSEQNGYYSDELDFYVKDKDGNIINHLIISCEEV